MAVTISVVLTYLIVKYMPYFKRQDQSDKQVTILLPEKRAFFIRRSDDDVNHSIGDRMNLVSKGTFLPVENAWITGQSKVDISHSTVEKKTRLFVKDTDLPAGNCLIIRPSHVNLNQRTVDNNPITIDAAKKLSVWRFLKRRRVLKRNILRKSILNLLLKTSLMNRQGTE